MTEPDGTAADGQVVVATKPAPAPPSPAQAPLPKFASEPTTKEQEKVILQQFHLNRRMPKPVAHVRGRGGYGKGGISALYLEHLYRSSPKHNSPMLLAKLTQCNLFRVIGFFLLKGNLHDAAGMARQPSLAKVCGKVRKVSSS
eukprot:7132574-Pyramimonas_sp.AAC.1